MKKIDFWNTPQPYNDFLVFSFEKGRIKDSLKSTLKSKLKDIGISNFVNKHYGKFESISAISYIEKDLMSSDGDIPILSGIAQHNGTLYFGQDSIKGKSDFLDNSVGIFTLLNINVRGIKITQDFMGSGTLFYVEFDDIFISSNRYHLLLLFLSWIGFKGELNYAKVIANLYSSTTFLKTNISEQMDIEGVFQLPFNSEIIINNDGWFITEKLEVVEVLKGCRPDERKELMKKAKEEILENIAAVLNQERFSKVIVDISGGYDSRAVFAGVLNFENAMNFIEIYARDVPGQNDLEIAAGLKSLFNGKFYEETGRKQYPMTTDESLNVFRSSYMGTFYNLAYGAWSPKGENNEEIRLSGGYGEIFRLFWYKVYKNIMSDNLSTNELASKLVDSFPPITKSMLKYKDTLIELIKNEFDKINCSCSDSIEKFEKHYQFFRNRYHIGMKAFQFYNDCPIWYPLMSKSLLRVANSLNYKDKLNEELILEVIENLHPLLPWIDFGEVPSQQNEGLQKIEISDVRFKNCKVEINKNLDNWKLTERKNQETLLKERPKMEESFYLNWRDNKSHLNEELFLLVDYLREYNSLFKELLDNEMVEYLKNIKNNRLINEMYSKLCSLYDQIEIFRDNGSSHELEGVLFEKGV